jgi:hypothetical protein
MQSERPFSIPAVEVQHYPIGDDPIIVDSAHQVSERYEAMPSDQSAGAGEFARVGILRMGSEIAPTKLQLLLEWARRQANNAGRFFAGN